MRQIDWIEPWTAVLDWSDAPFARWFVGGKLNISVNCLDRHVANGLGDKVAYHWEGEPGDQRTITYAQLLAETCQLTNALRELGVKKGDRVAIYMPMIPELPVAMLACARIGAPHSVVFGGFSADALAGRLEDAQCTTVITADGGYRKGAMVPLKDNADDAMGRSPSVEHCIVVRRTGQDVAWTEGRDHWYHDLVASQPTTAEPEATATKKPSGKKTTAPEKNEEEEAGLKAGTYKGKAVQHTYGTVQVTIKVSGGKITAADATFPKEGFSGTINPNAVKSLNASALKKQSADVDAVSGATLTSGAYASSLQAALDKAA